MKSGVLSKIGLSIIFAGLFLFLLGANPSSARAASPTIIKVGSVQELMACQARISKGNCQIILADGDYLLPGGLVINGSNVTIKSASGKRDAVTLRGAFKISHIFWVTGDNAVLQDMTLGQVNNHGIQVHAEADADNTIIRNIRFYDIKEQMIKGSGSQALIYSNNGIIENCLFEFTRGSAFGYYTGGIDIHRGDGWLIRGNTFRNIISPEEELSEGAIHMRSASRNTIIENNRIINCDRGIMLGFDNEYHYGGIVRNNFVHTIRDTGIYLCNCDGGIIYNNTVFVDCTYPNAIEYRFAGTNNTRIINNLTNARITRRDQASAFLAANLTQARSEWFTNAPAGDLHLKAQQTSVCQQARDLLEVPVDIDGDPRLPGKSDIGADEYK